MAYKKIKTKKIYEEVADVLLESITSGKLQPGDRLDSVEQLAEQLDAWRLDARTVNLMVGGPEGLAPEVCAKSEQRWSLSPLTLPHPLVRVLLGEQIYRAWTVLAGHPYHK